MGSDETKAAARGWHQAVQPARPSNALEGLVERLVALRPVLARNGVVQRRTGSDRRPAHRLRYRDEDPARGCRRHKSIALGLDSVARQVAAIVQAWREEHRRQASATREQAKEAARIARAERHQRRQERRQFQDACGGGSRRRRREAGRQFDRAAAEGPAAVLLLQLGRRAASGTPRPPGRPRKGALVLIS